ncbi:AMP-dependent synthetase and ligase [Halothece sp. PCC 7418]|uniref:2-succinylbenzoate--CoA ligase n=1 Tax=Halothece sp. (strain PCC 7418) TaxID=65093 RepID=UPI0002A0815B|nr:2-succinylbenzoate--CoA ligase [Halothece sp. PCC 7418]AFZ43634.1 AMP-dependent synthetase and ligase [Halothece sp. PCC 7418]
MKAAQPTFEYIIQKIPFYTIQDIFQDDDFKRLANRTLDIYSQVPQGSTVLVKTSHSEQFLANFLAALAKNCTIYLGNSQWQAQEWNQVLELVKPDLIIQETGLEFRSSFRDRKRQGTIMIPTGGSSGEIRFVEHTWETLSASVKGFCHYFQQETVNCFCILPLHHVSGLMQFMRTFLTGGDLILSSYKTLETAWRNQDSVILRQLERIPPNDYFISLVPTQLQRLLNFGAGNWLSQFKVVLLGGAPSWESLLETARQDQIPIALTYGMTETASQVVTLQPDDFRAGNNSVGQVLPHAKITIQGEFGEALAAGKVGKIMIESESLGLGYHPNSNWNRKQFITDDLGYFDEAGYLYIVGRNSRKIITGGENVFPDEVEAAILATGLVTDVYVMGVTDQNWGEVVSAIYVPKDQSLVPDLIQEQLKQNLSPYKIPKQWSALSSIPRNEQGKINSILLKNLINSY